MKELIDLLSHVFICATVIVIVYIPFRLLIENFLYRKNWSQTIEYIVTCVCTLVYIRIAISLAIYLIENKF